MQRESVFNASPWRATASLSVPSLISIVVMLLYKMADALVVLLSIFMKLQIAVDALRGSRPFW